MTIEYDDRSHRWCAWRKVNGRLVISDGETLTEALIGMIQLILERKA